MIRQTKRDGFTLLIKMIAGLTGVLATIFSSMTLAYAGFALSGQDLWGAAQNAGILALAALLVYLFFRTILVRVTAPSEQVFKVKRNIEVAKTNPTPIPKHPAPIPVKEAFAGLVLEQTLKDELEGLLTVIRNSNAWRDKWGAAPPLGLILEGPPGNGKTEIAKAFARAGGYHFEKLTGADVRSSASYGEAEVSVKQAYERAKENAPSVVFIDEIDGLAAKRRDNPFDGASSADNNVVNQLLQELQGFEEDTRMVFTIGATNRLSALDEAVVSRLRTTMHIPNPDRGLREEMLESFTKPQHDRGRLNADLGFVADVTEGFSGRDLTNLISRAVVAAERDKLDSLSTECLLKAAAKISADKASPGSVDEQDLSTLFAPHP